MRSWMIAVAALAIGCGSKKSEDPPGNASGVTSPATPASPPTADQLAARFEQCTGYFADGNWDDFASCYATGAIFEQPGVGTLVLEQELAERKEGRTKVRDFRADPQLVMVSGNQVIAIVWVTARADDRSIGFLRGNVVSYDASGRVTKDVNFLDPAIVAAQLEAKPGRTGGAWPTKMSQISKGDAAEQANLAGFTRLIAAFNTRDAKAVGALLPATLVWSEQPLPADLDRTALLATLEARWRGFSDLTFTVQASWAAGAYVAAAVTMEGTNDGALPALALDKTGRKLALPMLLVGEFANGTLNHAWIFYRQSVLEGQLGD